MSQMLAGDNVRLLQRVIDLLRSMDDGTYTRKVTACFGGWIGAHVRHCHDFYALLLSGYPGGQVDYDCRERAPRLETDRAYAIGKLGDLVAALSALEAEQADAPLRVRMDCGGGAPEADWRTSNLSRELTGLAFHDIHHHALIAFMLHTMGRETPPGFGVAPATLAYQQGQDECAR